jgi:hypothetical protein
MAKSFFQPLSKVCLRLERVEQPQDDLLTPNTIRDKHETTKDPKSLDDKVPKLRLALIIPEDQS